METRIDQATIPTILEEADNNTPHEKRRSSIEERRSSIHVNTPNTFDSEKLITHASSQTVGFFGKVTKKLARYNMLYDFFINSNMQHTKNTTVYKDVLEDSMLDTDIDQIDDNQVFTIGIARKLCLNIPMTIHHASLAFRDESGKFLIIGRQNAQFLKKDMLEDKPSFAWWVVSHINFNTVYNFTETQMGNEKHYEFFPGSLFDVEMTEATLTGAEIKKLVKETDNDVCSRPYDVVHSNCYSAVFYGLTRAIKLIADRVDLNYTKNDEDIKSIFTVISSAFQDNHQFGLGGNDNSTVVNALGHMIKKMQKLRLLEITSEPQSPRPLKGP